MSGIAGIIHFDGKPVEPGLIEKMTSAMAYRGPDGLHHWVKGSVALGQCMLHSTPESHGEKQPLVDEARGLVIVFDGRLDNRNEISRGLNSHGIQCAQKTDAELILGAYKIWGADCANYLLGDFVFAVWDELKNALLIARDQIGARPLYYAKGKRFLAFASEDEALLSVPGVSRSPNVELIAHFLVPQFTSFNGWKSWLEDVFILPPSHTITASNDGVIDLNEYWTLDGNVPELKYSTDREYQEAFLDVFGRAVRSRMRAPGNVSAMVSGGLDSASIAVTVRRLLPEFPRKKFHAYSAVSDSSKSCIETQCIESVTRSCGADAKSVSIPSLTGMVGLQDLSRAAFGKAHPVDNSVLLVSMMCRAAAKQGDRVLLHGVSGDVTLNAPIRYPAHLIRNGEWRSAWRECTAAAKNHAYLRGSRVFSLRLKNVWSAFAPPQLRFLYEGLRNKGDSLSQSLISEKFCRELSVEERLRSQRKKVAGRRRSVNEEWLARVSSPGFGLSTALTGYEHVAGQYGVELRDPWADRRVLEFFLQLPLRFRVRDGWTKYLVRTSFAQDLAPMVTQRRSKEHLGWQFPNTLMIQSGPLIWGVIRECMGLVDGYLDVDKFRERYPEKDINYYDKYQIEEIYDIVTLMLWLKRLNQSA
jgi:asparagine synthase (glutamine-hydrolysing)